MVVHARQEFWRCTRLGDRSLDSASLSKAVYSNMVVVFLQPTPLGWLLMAKVGCIPLSGVLHRNSGFFGVVCQLRGVHAVVLTLVRSDFQENARKRCLCVLPCGRPASQPRRHRTSMVLAVAPTLNKVFQDQ